MTVLHRVLRSHVRCDDCTSVYVFVDAVNGSIVPSLVDAGWKVQGERHVCPRCARRAT